MKVFLKFNEWVASLFSERLKEEWTHFLGIICIIFFSLRDSSHLFLDGNIFPICFLKMSLP